MENMEILKNVFLFRNLPTLELLKFNKVIKHSSFKKDDIIIKQGEKGDMMYIVKNGSINIFVSLDKDNEDKKLIAVLGPGDHFGEMALFDDALRSATVESREEVDLLTISRGDLEHIMNSDKDLAVLIYKEMVASLSERLRKTNEMLLL